MAAQIPFIARGLSQLLVTVARIWPMKKRPDHRRPPRPLDSRQMEELALAYVARFATTAAKLEAYLTRKLRERGWSDDGEPPAPGLVAGIVTRFVAAGYIDDGAWARAKSGSLMRRGYGMRRVAQALFAAGISQEQRGEVRPSEDAQRRAALALAKKRRFGPFGEALQDRTQERARRERQIAAMLRAGHPLDSARELVNAASIASAEAWAAHDDGEDLCD